MKTQGIILVTLFCLSMISPLAQSDTTTSTFDDGTTSFEHKFSSAGITNAGEITMPYGAEVTEAEFNIRGEASQTTFTNFTTNNHYGGLGDEDGYASNRVPTPFTAGYRYYLNTQNNGLELKGNPTKHSISFARDTEVSSLGNAVQDSTQQYVAMSDQDYSSISKRFSDFTVDSSASWQYMGVVIMFEDEYLIAKYSSSYPSQMPSILRINATTGDYIGLASLNPGTCSGTSTQSLYNNLYDAVVYNGSIWTVHYSYYTINKWAVSKTPTALTLNCQQSYYMSNLGYINGIDVDNETSKMYISTYSFSVGQHYLHEVDISDPTQVNATWSLSSSGNIKSSYGSGLIVNSPTIIYNEYDRGTSNYPSTHHYYNFESLSLDLMGSMQMNNMGHYGLTDDGEGKLTFACHYTSTCSNHQRKVLRFGDASVEQYSLTSSATETVYGATRTISSAVSEFSLNALVGHMPSGTSIDLEVSNDGGSTWLPISVGQTVQFSQPGFSLDWRATLSSNNGVSPILDYVEIQFVSTYRTNGYFYGYQYVGSGASSTVAATLSWNANTPAGTDVRVYFAASSSSSSCTASSSGVQSWSKTESGQTKTITGSSYYMCFRVQLTTSNSAVTPTFTDFSIARHSNAPQEPAIHFAGTKVWSRAPSAGALVGEVNILQQNPSDSMIDALNDLIPDIGSGMITIPVNISSQSSGVLELVSFTITYTIKTVNLEIDIDETQVLHQRVEPYEIVTKHVIGENANSMNSASLTFLTTTGSNPVMTWQPGDVFPLPNDPDNYIEVDESSWSQQTNDVLEIHWRFRINLDFPEQEIVRFKADCEDSSGLDGFTPASLLSSKYMSVNHNYGLGWLKVSDQTGAVISDNLADNSWVAAGETIFFQGAIWYVGTQDAPLDNMFDIRVSRDGWIESTAYDTMNNNGTFFIPITIPDTDKPEGYTFEVQIFNELDASLSVLPNSDWQRTYRVDNTPPEKIATQPVETSYEAASFNQVVKVLVNDEIGNPTVMTLNYWVEADHDTNKNGLADSDEYATMQVTNYSDEPSKWFIAEIDHSRNPNMGRVSYFWSGHDQAGNELFSSYIDSEGEVKTYQTTHGFDYDDATFTTRKDSVAQFTEFTWHGHEDNMAVYSGMKQHISFGFIDENTVIDFEHISLIFDFEGPNTDKDQQKISFSGYNNTFWSESDFINILSQSSVTESQNEIGLPLIELDFVFEFGWDWPDENYGDLILLYKERGSEFDTGIILSEHTFRVENDLVISSNDYSISDVSEPKTGEVSDGSKVRKDDRLAFSGHIVYEGSNVAPPQNLGILVEVFDGELIWTDGSLGEEGQFMVEVALSSAPNLQSSSTRTCLISINNIPGKGEDMTGTDVSSTLQIIVDDSPPRVLRRTAPLNTIDISSISDLTKVEVEFFGYEDADLTGSEQYVHWVMKDSTKTITIGSGFSRLGSVQNGNDVVWSGSVDLTDSGKIYPRAGDYVGFFLTGWDGAGNNILTNSNSESNPIPELADDDNDLDRQWVKLGSLGPELSVVSISLSDDHVAPGAEITIDAVVLNYGGPTEESFKVSFFAGDEEKPFESITVAGIKGSEQIIVSTNWEVKDVNRITVHVDYENYIVEVNDNDNSAQHSIDVAYGKYLGWFDSPRENPLTWIFIIMSAITLIIVGTIASRTSIDYSEGALQDDYGWDDEESGDYGDLEESDYYED